jgi:hypothetical protein
VGWARCASAGQWADGAFRYLGIVNVDNNNTIRIWQGNVANTLRFYSAFGGAVADVDLAAINYGVAWFTFALTWSRTANEYKAYLQGIQAGVTKPIGAAWAGVLDTALLGAFDVGATNPWLGYLAHVAFWNVPLSASEIKHISEV